jgi:hypothetical protein
MEEHALRIDVETILGARRIHDQTVFATLAQMVLLLAGNPRTSQVHQVS